MLQHSIGKNEVYKSIMVQNYTWRITIRTCYERFELLYEYVVNVKSRIVQEFCPTDTAFLEWEQN